MITVTGRLFKGLCLTTNEKTIVVLNELKEKTVCDVRYADKELNDVTFGISGSNDTIKRAIMGNVLRLLTDPWVGQMRNIFPRSASSIDFNCHTCERSH